MTQKAQNILDLYPEDYASDRLRKIYKQYLMSKEGERIKSELIYFLDPFLRNKDKLSDIVKAQLLYTIITKNITYNKSEKSDIYNDMRYSFLGCLAYKKAVCMGIAEFYTLLGSALGLKVITVIGYGGGEAHAWNIIWLNNNGKLTPYHLDATWDLGNLGVLGNRFCYFLKSDEYMRKNSHEWKSDRYPPCPENRTTFPQIPYKVVDSACTYFNQTQKRLQDLKFRKAG